MDIGIQIPDSVYSPERLPFRLQGPVRLQQHGPVSDIERDSHPASLYRADRCTRPSPTCST
jgi:hypothetical protein